MGRLVELGARARESIAQATLGTLQRRRSFEFDGERYQYHSAPYNATWANERTVELPIALRLLQRNPVRTLEVGNVLHHYVDEHHEVVDKYETAPGVRNVDVLDFQVEEPYDLIVSISTFEHIGFDEDVKDPEKPARALEHLAAMLAPGGTLLVTIPLGYNPTIDEALSRGTLRFDRTGFLQRISRDNRWRQVAESACAGVRYGRPYPQANAVAVGIRRAGVSR